MEYFVLVTNIIFIICLIWNAWKLRKLQKAIDEYINKKTD